jgi:hypothetical protein
VTRSVSANPVLARARQANAARFAAIAPPRPAEGVYSLGFCLFLLVNAVLFIRPAEIVTDLEGLPIYESVILAALLVSVPAMARQLAGGAIVSKPILTCVVCMWLAIVAHYVRIRVFWHIREEGFEFFKVVLYFLLMIANVTTVGRLKHFLYWLVGFIFALTVLALLNFYEVIDIASLVRMKEREIDPDTGAFVYLARLCSTGIYDNPNALARILLVGMAISFYLFSDVRGSLGRLIGLCLLALFTFSLFQTQSRGGFIGFLVGVLTLFTASFGWRKSLPLAIVVLPVIFMLFGGRQTEIAGALSQGTGQSRIQLWSQGFAAWKESPLFGIGMHQFEKYAENGSHNSFVQWYVELGFLGGTLFVSVFYLTLSSIFRLGLPKYRILDPELAHLHPHLAAMLSAYTAGMFSIAVGYLLPTFMILGLATVFISLIKTTPPFLKYSLNFRLFMLMILLSLAVVTCIYGYVRLFVHWG